MVVKKKILYYRINDSTEIQLNYVGGGATAPDYLTIIKKDLLNNTNKTIMVLDGFSEDYVFHINPYNDSEIILNIIDTNRFAVVERDQNFRININQIDTTLNKYKSGN